MMRSRRINEDWRMKQVQYIRSAKSCILGQLKMALQKNGKSSFAEGNTMSRLYVNGTLHSWIHYIELRSVTTHS